MLARVFRELRVLFREISSVVPEIQVEQIAHIFSPRLANPAQAVDFKMEVVEEPPIETHCSSSQNPERQCHSAWR